jgi:hypothetical protein
VLFSSDRYRGFRRASVRNPFKEILLPIIERLAMLIGLRFELADGEAATINFCRCLKRCYAVQTSMTNDNLLFGSLRVSVVPDLVALNMKETMAASVVQNLLQALRQHVTNDTAFLLRSKACHTGARQRPTQQQAPAPPVRALPGPSSIVAPAWHTGMHNILHRVHGSAPPETAS